MSVTDDLLRNNEAYAATFDKGDLPLPPAKKVAVVACMDARLDVHGLLGLQLGDAHVIRNAGGVVTDDEIRSLAISQRLLGTEEIVLIHHTDCGMLTFTDDEFKRQVQDDTGIKPEWAAEAFPDLDEDVRQSIARIKASPFIPNKDSVRGFVNGTLPSSGTSSSSASAWPPPSPKIWKRSPPGVVKPAMFSTMPAISSDTLPAICAARRATFWAAGCGVVAMRNFACGRSCDRVMETSPVPGGRSTSRWSSSP